MENHFVAGVLSRPFCICLYRVRFWTVCCTDEMVDRFLEYDGALFYIFCIIIPVAVPVILWGETMLHAILAQCFIRYVIVLNSTWSINSAAHLWGYRPYNRVINPAENIMLSLVTHGEGFHNYHHTFPWDYKASELPYSPFILTGLFIYLFSKIGWSYDLREPSPAFVQKVMQEIRDNSNLSSKIY
nr:acyl-CoA Delta-9 desaturase-like isoform X1 [Neodiprion pinetum]